MLPGVPITLAGFSLGLLFNPEYKGNKFLRNVGFSLTCTTLYPKDCIVLRSPTSTELSWVYLTADCQSTSSSWYRAPLWGPWLIFILSLSLVAMLCCSSCRAPSLTRGRVCNLQYNRWVVRSQRTNNHTLPLHLRLCSLFVASYDSLGLRWRYCNPPPHGVPT
jgi:hypothetical protein